MNQEIYIVSAVRTAIGDFGESLKDFSPTRLGAIVIRDAIRRAGIEAAEVEHAVFGNVIPTEAADLSLGRSAAIEAGIPDESPGLTVNRLCGSGAQAIVSAAQMMLLGEARVTVAGGAESMSRAPISISGMRFGTKMGNGVAYDWLTNTLTDPFGHGHMGETAENVATMTGIGRERQDALAVESHRRAALATAEGRFKEQIVPVEIKRRKETVLFDTDEHIRANTTVEGLAKLRPAFRKEGTVTAGNSSGINDGAAAVILMTGDEVRRRNITPLGRLMAWGHAGVPAGIMGIGPVKAVPLALARARISAKDIDVIESNEAFAVQALAVCDGLDLSVDKVNPNGGAVALGHPLGATGAILTVKALYELKRTGGRYGLITMCIGGGQGIALVVERTA